MSMRDLLPKNLGVMGLSIFVLFLMLNGLWAIPRSASATNWYNFGSGFNSVQSIATDNSIKADKDVTKFIRRGVNVALGFVGILAVAALIYGGFMYISSLGDEGKAKTAKHIIFYAIIGLVVIGAAGLIVNVVVNDIIQ